MHAVDISILSRRNEALTAKLALLDAQEWELKVQLEVSEAQCQVSEAQCWVSEAQCRVSEAQCQVSEAQCWVSEAQCWASEAQRRASDAMLQASDTCAMICNLENQELRRQLAEKTGTHKKRKLNIEGCIITPLDALVLFLQQEAECWEREAAEEAKNKSKTDAVLLREHQHVLTADTKVFANPLTSYTHKDDILDIVVTLSLDHTGTKATLTKRIRTHLASHPDIASQTRFSGLMKARKSRKRRHRRVDAPSQDQGGPSVSKETT